MNATRPNSDPPGFLSHRFATLLTLLAVAFVLQTGLVPFDFFSAVPGGGISTLLSAGTDHVTFADAVSNIFLYVPVGLLLHGQLRRVGKRWGFAWLITIATGAALSLAIEWLQSYSPSRVSSAIDLLANIVGTAMGATVSLLMHWLIPRMVGAALYEFHVRPHASLVKAYCTLLVILAALPFSFSLDTGRLKQAVKGAVIVPFAPLPDTASAADPSRPEISGRKYQETLHAKWRTMKRWSRWAAECVSFAFLVWLLQPLLRGTYQFSSRAALGLTWWLGGGLAVALSLIQFPILTRGFDSTDIVFRFGGIALGLASRSIHRRLDARGSLHPATHYGRNFVWVGCAAAAVYILYAGLIPLTFTTAHGGPAAAIASPGFLPFFAYLAARFDLMMDDVMEKFAAYAMFGAFLSTVWLRASGARVFRSTLAVVAVAVGFAAAIEVAQTYIPVRVASLTDLLLAGGGCLTGVAVKGRIIRFYHYALSHRMHGPQEAGVERRSTMGPVDTLIATLTEPDPNAPIEPTPAPRARPAHRR